MNQARRHRGTADERSGGVEELKACTLSVEGRNLRNVGVELPQLREEVCDVGCRCAQLLAKRVLLGVSNVGS